MDFESVAVNLRESFRAIAASRAPGEIRELRGVSIASAGVTFQMFNSAFLSAPVANEAELARRIMLPSVHFDARGLQLFDDLDILLGVRQPGGTEPRFQQIRIHPEDAVRLFQSGRPSVIVGWV